MDLGLIGQAVGMFAATNVDDIVLLALFFGQAAGHRGAAVRVVAGQYLGFAAILAASILGALGAGLLPATVIPYLGLLPLALGAARHGEPGANATAQPTMSPSRPPVTAQPCSRSPP